MGVKIPSSPVVWLEMTERGLKVKESFGTDEYAHCLDYDDDSTAMYICQDLSDSTLQIHVVYCMIIPQ